jgi:hypothetical protein
MYAGAAAMGLLPSSVDIFGKPHQGTDYPNTANIPLSRSVQPKRDAVAFAPFPSSITWAGSQSQDADRDTQKGLPSADTDSAAVTTDSAPVPPPKSSPDTDADLTTSGVVSASPTLAAAPALPPPTVPDLRPVPDTRPVKSSQNVSPGLLRAAQNAPPPAPPVVAAKRASPKPEVRQRMWYK